MDEFHLDDVGAELSLTLLSAAALSLLRQDKMSARVCYPALSNLTFFMPKIFKDEVFENSLW